MQDQNTHGMSARDRVYAYVRDAILHRRIAAGSFLEEEQVSAAVGVSRTPVREAFHRLEAERWLDLVPRRGAMVRAVTAQELVEVYELRRVLEAHVARRVCAEAIVVPERAWTLLQAMRDDNGVDIALQVELDQAFHGTLVATLGNQIMTETYASLRSRQQRVALSALGASPGRLQVILDEHEALLQALQARDAEAAVAVLDQHLRPLGEIMVRLGR